MAMRVIEMVCTGNSGRSPVAELLGQNYINSRGFNHALGVRSSGTMVNKILSGGKMPMQAMIPILDTGVSRGMYNSEELAKIRAAVRIGDADGVRDYFARAAVKFEEEEVQFRNEAIHSYGIRGEVKSGRDQTIARPDTVAVLAIDRKNYDTVKKIYDNSGYTPIIDVMSRVATGNPDAEVRNAFGLGKEAYFERFIQLWQEVPEAVAKIAKNESIWKNIQL
jgi:hypothetical protein